MPLPERAEPMNTREAFNEGKMARKHGMSKDDNPHTIEHKELRDKWNSGWSIMDSKIEAGMKEEINHD